MKYLMVVVVFSLALAGCVTSQHLTALPMDLNPDAVPRETIDVHAVRYQFTPDVIHVKAGTLVTLKVTADDDTHGFAISDYDIDETLEQGQTRQIDIYFTLKGEFQFSCSHFCGVGHFGMNGKIIVE